VRNEPTVSTATVQGRGDVGPFDAAEQAEPLYEAPPNVRRKVADATDPPPPPLAGGTGDGTGGEKTVLVHTYAGQQRAHREQDSGPARQQGKMFSVQGWYNTVHEP